MPDQNFPMEKKYILFFFLFQIDQQGPSEQRKFFWGGVLCKKQGKSEISDCGLWQVSEWLAVLGTGTSLRYRCKQSKGNYLKKQRKIEKGAAKTMVSNKNGKNHSMFAPY